MRILERNGSLIAYCKQRLSYIRKYITGREVSVLCTTLSWYKSFLIKIKRRTVHLYDNGIGLQKHCNGLTDSQQQQLKCNEMHPATQYPDHEYLHYYVTLFHNRILVLWLRCKQASTQPLSQNLVVVALFKVFSLSEWVLAPLGTHLTAPTVVLVLYY